MDSNTPRIMKQDSKTRIVRRGFGTAEPQTLIKLCIGTPAAKPVLVNIGQRAILGRVDHNGFDLDINLAAYEAAQKGVSRLHASLEVVNLTIMVSDLGSTNGTFLNGHRLTPGQPCTVREGDQLRLGKLLLYVFYAMAAHQA